MVPKVMAMVSCIEVVEELVWESWLAKKCIEGDTSDKDNALYRAVKVNTRNKKACWEKSVWTFLGDNNNSTS